MAVIHVNEKPVDIGNERLNLIQAALKAGVFIPYYCWHPALTVVASCRMCMVEVGERKPDGSVAMQPRVVPACQMLAKEGMVVVSNSPKARSAQRLTLEGLLLNHPLDCPVCDKAGECLLQDYSFRYGSATSRMIDEKQARRDQIHLVGTLTRKALAATQEAAKAVALADEIALLTRWLRYDVFAVSALPYADRCALFDFILAELKAREPLCPHRLGPVHTLLKNHRDQLLAFAAQLDHDLANLAAEFQVPLAIVRELLDLQALDKRQPLRWQKEVTLRQQLRHRFFRLEEAVRDLADHVVRASSIIENLNSRLRNYFFLRRKLGSDYLTLLQFFLNHRRFLRSERQERVGKSPTELLIGQSHQHWLEMLGYTRFSQN